MEREIKVAIFSCLPMVLVGFFLLPLAPLSVILLMGALIIFVIMLLWSIVNIFINFKNGFRISFGPFLVFVLSIIITSLVSNVWRELDYSIKFKGRQEIVEMIKHRKLKENENGYIKLPRRFESLSRGGSVSVKRNGKSLWVEFRTFYGWIDSFEGLIYSSTDKLPSKTVFFWSSSYLYYEHKSRNWFYYFHE